MKFVTVAAMLGTALAASWDDELTQEDLVGVELRTMFQEWAAAFDRQYTGNVEAANRFKVWLDNLKTITDHNSDDDYNWYMRLNQFGDMTPEEFRHYIHGGQESCLNDRETGLRLTPITKDEKGERRLNEAPASVDWEAEGDVTPVKNQGSCGSCWAFASTGAIECNYAINHKELNSLSEQQLVDCTRDYGNDGCDGGWWYNAFDYVKAVGGLCTEEEYPYEGVDGVCKDKSCGTYYDPITGYTEVKPDDEQALLDAVATGCVSIGVEADQSSFQFYSSGVLTGKCGTEIDHGVLAVGYGEMNGEDYWKVKNSWGVSWGDKGYLYICRSCNKNGDEGECGINMYPYQPRV